MPAFSNSRPCSMDMTPPPPFGSGVVASVPRLADKSSRRRSCRPLRLRGVRIRRRDYRARLRTKRARRPAYVQECRSPPNLGERRGQRQSDFSTHPDFWRRGGLRTDRARKAIGLPQGLAGDHGAGERYIERAQTRPHGNEEAGVGRFDALPPGRRRFHDPSAGCHPGERRNRCRGLPPWLRPGSAAGPVWPRERPPRRHRGLPEPGRDSPCRPA